MEAAPQIRRGDDRIDKLYRRLEEECADLLCQKRLSQAQVREVLSFMHCLRDLERFGDYCKELAAWGSIAAGAAGDHPRRRPNHAGSLSLSLGARP